MTKSTKPSPQIIDTGSILNVVPDGSMGAFVDALLKRIPMTPVAPSSSAKPPLGINRVETEEAGPKEEFFPRLKTVRSGKVPSNKKKS